MNVVFIAKSEIGITMKSLIVMSSLLATCSCNFQNCINLYSLKINIGFLIIKFI